MPYSAEGYPRGSHRAPVEQVLFETSHLLAFLRKHEQQRELLVADRCERLEMGVHIENVSALEIHQRWCDVGLASALAGAHNVLNSLIEEFCGHDHAIRCIRRSGDGTVVPLRPCASRAPLFKEPDPARSTLLTLRVNGRCQRYGGLTVH